MTGVQTCALPIYQPTRLGFKGPLGVWSDFKTENYYMENLIGEEKISGWVNLVALGVLTVLLAGVF